MVEWTLVGLRVVVEVARTGSFSAAAGKLGYTQSAVSRQVAVAEKIAQTPLFERHARGVRPTPAGEVLVRHASRVLDGVTTATQELAGLRDRLAGRLVVGGFPAAAAVLLPRAIARLTAAHPGLRVRLAEESTPSQLLALRRGRLEVAILATGDGLPEYDLAGLRRTELRGGRRVGVAVADSHPFACRESVDPAELAEQPWVVGARVGEAPEFGTWPGIADPVISFAARHWSTRLGLVAAGLGIALVPALAAQAMPQGVHWIPVRDRGDGLGRTVWAVTNPEPGPAAVAMVDAVAEELGSLGAVRVSADRTPPD
ncbi:DNA-binding transcriptional LysR family regulator [Actinoalloteichus hoggarensis]|uniref:HTH-type transcriptional regulator BenM n=1 Tax=Actinoalloteichus hoggarensis TaxID=1470176 RepID=A0A221VYN9_9PSEU|nr:LysR family transcriptional regulator [Actinoalloteichus hoggarensis]ASO18655.1 HTH-type transcriptional regulator BenM [Actinoalloteichus hoggarensis]MBB5919886.1 DNA-binding transcriptional LysR family regulator [Actinoalloteichus hoggarensis]